MAGAVTPPTGEQLGAAVAAALDVYDAAMTVCLRVMDLPAPRPPELVAATRTLMRTLVVAGVLDGDA